MKENVGVFVISVAAELAGMHPQTLRQYDRLGIVSPDRTAGRGRRYSPRDIERLRQVQQLSQEDGINLEGIRRIMGLEQQLNALRAEVAELTDALTEARAEVDQARRVFAAGATGDVVALRRGARPQRRTPGSAVMVWRPVLAIEQRHQG